MAFEREAARWRTALGWDTADLWPALEKARRAGRLPGLTCRADDGRLAGWTYFLARDHDVHCGGLTATSPAETAALVDGLLASPLTAAASRVVVFAFADAPGLDQVLATRGFSLDPHDFMSVALSSADRRGGAPGRAWDVRDLDATADLLRASYVAHDPARPFAPSGRPSEWRQYAAELVLGQGCGRIRPTLSIVVPGEGGVLDAVALVTDIGAGSAHLAQLAVHPRVRGTGLGARLLAGVRAASAAAGFARLTLLVGGENARARGLYERAGLVAVARFVCAVRRGVTVGGVPAVETAVASR